MADADSPSSTIKEIMDAYDRAVHGSDEERAAARHERAARERDRDRASRSAQGDLWRKRRKARKGDGMFDFVFENPLHGRFKNLLSVVQLLDDHPDSVRRIDTSYCHFVGYEHNKPTVFITTLFGLNLPSPCPSNPCEAVRMGELHAARVAECDEALKNSIPHGITDSVVDAWLAKHAESGATEFVFIDVFAGHGSVHERVRARHPSVSVFANDIVDRGQEGVLDMTAYSPSDLLAMALARRFPDKIDAMVAHAEGAVGWAKESKTAVLLHMSTPCETYSTQALSVHRVAGTATPASAAARRADAMNDSLIAWVERVVVNQE